MKFSVLIPTRNRLEFLKYAIASVLQQQETDFEIIVFDNFSEQDIEGYISSLNEPRIKYFRTNSFVPVTENWNNALEKSSGDWVVMLGDDDCLMKGYFSVVNRLLSQFPDPDFVYMNSFLFAYPNVLPGYPNGLAKTFGNAGFVINQKGPYWLPKEEATNLVRKTFNFTCTFAFNMQFALLSRATIDKMKREGKFFHSPYPDYYAMTTLMLFADRILACPYPLVAVGISPKSFGYYYFNNIELKGIEFLKNENQKMEFTHLKDIVFPGTDMNTSWLFSLEKIKANFIECTFPINYKKYRLLQIIVCLNKFIQDSNEYIKSFKPFWKMLTFTEKCLYGFPWLLLHYFSSKYCSKYVKFLSKMAKSHESYPYKHIDEYFENIQQFFEKIDPLDQAFEAAP